MTAQAETLSTFQPWRQGNHFTVTLRGHWQKIPEPTGVLLLSDYESELLSEQFDSQIREVVGTTNYNTLYDSFYAPVDFKIRGLTVRMPQPVPKKAQLEISVKVNEGVIDKFVIPEFEDHNMKRYELDCDFLIYEDDFIEIEVTFSGYESLSFNENNIVVALSGCVSYLMYKELWADLFARAATTQEITLSGTQTVDGVALEVGDTVLVKNQSTTTDNGLYIVSSGAWTRSPGYPDLASLENVVVHITEGDTNKSDDATNFTAIENDGDYFIGYPLMSWEEGDNWYKTNIHLQNRSGNDTIQDRVFMDMLKSPMNFLFQGIRMSLFKDDLRVVECFREKVFCIYLDILVNGRSILPYTNFPRPIPIDTNELFRSYDMAAFDDSQGFPVRFGDSIDVRAYLQNTHTKYNCKLLNVVLYGCSPDCAAFDSPIVAVYEPCEEEPCVWKFAIVERCEPEQLRTTDEDGNPVGPSPYNPEVSPVVPGVPSADEYVTLNNEYITLDGERITI